MAFLILALQICDLCQQREKCFSMKAKKINLSPPFTVGFCNRGHVFISSCQPHKYLCLMNKSETKERAAGYRARESAHTVTQFHCARGSSFHPAPHSTCILRTAGFETDMSTHFQSREMFQSNGRLPRRLTGGGWERGESSLRLSHADGSNHMFLSFKKRPGGDVCQRTAGVRALYQCIAAALQFSLSLCHCSQLNLSGSSFELCVRCMFLILGGERKGLPQRYLNSFKKKKKKKDA